MMRTDRLIARSGGGKCCQIEVELGLAADAVGLGGIDIESSIIV